MKQAGVYEKATPNLRNKNYKYCHVGSTDRINSKQTEAEEKHKLLPQYKAQENKEKKTERTIKIHRG